MTRLARFTHADDDTLRGIMPGARGLVCGALVHLVGCGSENDVAHPPPPDALSCADPLALGLPDGSCIRPGVPVDGCAQGFVHDGEYGCNAVLPADVCPPGLMAVPGETDCRPVMPCGEGRWGDIAVDATTQYVDVAYTGGASDGSEAQPWTSIGAGVMAAEPGALVAIARGTYVEDVLISGKAVRLAGVCPDDVAIVGAGELVDPCLETPAICITAGADGTEVRGVAITGPGRGLFLTGSAEVLVDSVWVHETGARGISADNTLGAASLSVRGSLVDKSHRVGLIIAGSEAHIEASVVRNTLPDPADQSRGRGIVIQFPCPPSPTGPLCDPTVRASGSVVGSLVEQTRHDGLFVYGSDAHIEGSVVRDILPDSEQRFGVGIEIRAWCAETPTGVVCDPAARANVTVRGSLVERAHHHGLGVTGSDARIESTIVRDVSPRVSDQEHGSGIVIQSGCVTTPSQTVCDLAAPANATMLGSLVDRTHSFGIVVAASEAHIETSVVRETAPQSSDQQLGYGIFIQVACVPTPLGGSECIQPGANVSVLRSLVERNHTAGVLVFRSEARVESSIVRLSSPSVADGRFGDGIMVVGGLRPASLTLTRARIDESARAGLSTFGAFAALQSTRIHCAAFELAGESSQGQDFTLEDRGDNLCGCPHADHTCKAVSAGLEPPAPPEGTE